METPEIERRAIEDYLISQSGADFEVEHVEKLTSEYVLGHQYDVWDAHTNEGRWWVITPFTNLYSQDQIKSMDIALSFHIGLMSRVMSNNPIRFNQDGSRSWVLEVMRRLETAGDNLDRAKEVEDFQAVGMRLRETLLTLMDRLRSLDLEIPSTVELPAQDGNFKGWAEVFSGVLAPGSSSARFRKVLKAQSDNTWEYLGWLTHARNASALDGRLAQSFTGGLVEAFILAIERIERSAEERCPACSSYQISRQYLGDGDWIRLCGTCGWKMPMDPPVSIDSAGEVDSTGETSTAEVRETEGECVILEDFGVYITPSQVRSVLQEASARAADSEDQSNWTNPFAFYVSEDGSMHDAHRLVFAAHRHVPASGSELTYECSEDNCVNPGHAAESPLPSVVDWYPMLVESVVVGPRYLELQVAGVARGRGIVLIGADLLERYGMGDASSLLERVVFVSEPDKSGWLWLVPGARRVSYSAGSAVAGWSRTSSTISESAHCPCGSREFYAACHGQKTVGEDGAT